jgi:hypothetical protein
MSRGFRKISNFAQILLLHIVVFKNIFGVYCFRVFLSFFGSPYFNCFIVNLNLN